MPLLTKSYFIYPTISLKTFIRGARIQQPDKKVEYLLTSRYSQYTSKLTNSGRSAFAYIIESFSLQGKNIVFPSFLCNVFAPVITHYHIKPIFLDIELDTFQPPLQAYEQIDMSNVDAIFICETFGYCLSRDVKNFLAKSGKIVINDISHCLQCISNKDERQYRPDAMFFSLTKLFPIPSGGVALIKKNIQTDYSPVTTTRNITLAYVKQIIQLFSSGRAIIQFIKKHVHIAEIANTQFSGIHTPHELTKKLFVQTFQSPTQTTKFCMPKIYRDEQERNRVQTRLRQKNTYAERLWEDPLIDHPSMATYVMNKEFPITRKVSKRILCLPNNTEVQN